MNQSELNYSAYKYCETNKDKFISSMKPALKTKIITVAYFRFFQNGKYLYLCNDLKWVEFCLKEIHNNESTSLGKEIGEVGENDYHCYLWPTENKDFLLNALYENNIWNGLSLFKKLNDDSIELWGFAAEVNNSNMKHFYIENLNSLKEITKLCKLQNNDIFNLYKNEDLAIYKNHIGYASSEDSIKKHRLKKFLEETNYKKYPMIVNGEEIFLAKREKECMELLAMGKSAKEVAVDMLLSYRSVEKYVDNIRKKTGIKKQSSLVKSFNSSIEEWL
jgi:DNA-binding CsgD family transcriptional regulator